jgi:transposase, IS5 family
MRGQAGFFDVEERLRELSAKGDGLERLNGVVDFEQFRGDLERAVPRSRRLKGGRPPFDHVLMFKTLVLQARHNLSDERAEYLIRDRLSFMRFLGLGLADTVPDANTIWTFREALTRARIVGKPAIEVLFERFDAALLAAGFLAMSGQIIDASILAAPKQRNTDGEKRDIKEGRIPPQWAAKPAKLRQKDRDARWTVKYTKAKPGEDGLPRVRSRNPGLLVQKPYRHRPPASPDPPLAGHRCGAPRWGATARVDRHEQHRQRCLGLLPNLFVPERSARYSDRLRSHG